MKRRILSIITALALCLSLCPTWALAAEADPSLCKHHPEHTEDCGYTAPTEGHDCGHRHTAECYTKGVLPDADGGDYYEIGADTENLLDCQHSHDSECGYVEADPGAPCGYVCRICPIEDLIAALPEQVTEDNADDVRAQLDHILDLYRELDEGEQEEIDLSRIYALQGALDAANDPDPIAESVNYQEASWNGGVTYTTKTADSCTPVADSTTAVTWNAGWYVVNSTVTISEPITVSGAVNLILADGCTLNAEKGIVVETGNSLTIYAQSVGTGTLNATGTDSAGIGGAGRTDYGVDGGSSGAITIHGGNITATSQNGAGIGGGAPWAGANGGSGSNITIYGGSVTAQSTGTMGGAGIGGGGGSIDGGTGESINIYGGTVNATGGNKGAGIGGGSGSLSNTSGSGTNITISGGTVTAVGGNYAAGIGGGGGYYYSNNYGSGGCTGGTGSVTISGGIVDASSPTEVAYANYKGDPIGNGGNAGDTAATVSKTTGIVFENGAGTVCGDVTLDGSYTIPGDYTLNIPVGASLSGSGTLSGGSAFTTENLTADMISVPTNLYYNGEDRTADITTELSGELTTGVTICGQTFTVSGWTLAVEKAADSDLTYTAIYTNNSDNTKTVQKTITLLQSGTDLTDGKVKTYKDGAECSDFTAGDTITVKAMPTATGKAPDNSAMFAASFTAPTAGQMAVFVGDTQVSAPVGAVDGSYTMTVSAADVLLAAGGPGTEITLTARFTANDNMADGAGTVTVSITAVAKAERDGNVIDYFGVSDFEGINGAFFKDAYASATVALLDDITPASDSTTGKACSTAVNITCTLDLAGHNFTSTDIAIYVLPGGNLTIQDSSTGKTGTVSSIKSDGTLKLYGGTFGKIETAYTLSSLLAENCAYYKGSTPILLSELEGKTELTGPVTVQACQHTAAEYTPNENDASTHTKTCLACGYTETGDCGFEKTADPTADSHTGQCPDCKRDRSGAHSFSDWAGNPVARTCTVCGYEQTAVARVEKDSTTTYVGALANAFTEGNSGATVTLLDDVTITEAADRPRINIRCTLNLNGHTIRSDAAGAPPLEVSGYGNVTITGSGEIVSNSDAALYVVGTAVLEGGIFRSGGTYHGAVEVLRGNLSVTGENVVMENTGSGNGLLIYSLKSVKLSAGKYSGAAGAISVSTDAFTLSSLLNQVGASRVAYYKDNTTLVTEGLDGQALPGGSYTVKECTHAYQYAHTPGTTVHSQTCPACGDAKASEKCDFSNGPCPCGAVLAVTQPADLNLTYNGTAQEPGVTVTVDGTTTLTKDTDYSVAYENNVEAGEDTAKVTVTGTTFTGTTTLNFSIGKATPTITWSSTTQELTFTGQQAAITAPTVMLVNNESFGGTIHYSYTGTTSGTGLPQNAGTYTIKASIAVQDNYTAADSTNTLTLTIKQARVTITWGSSSQSVDYSGKPAEITAPTITAEGGVAVSVTPTYSYHQEDGEAEYRDGLPTNAGTYSIMASIEESGNLTAARADMMLIINKAPLTITGATVASKTYDGTDTATVSGVTFTGLVNGETLALGTDYTATGTFADANAGEGKSVTVTVTLTSDKTKNYSLAQNTTAATGTINRASSSITTAPTASGITYGQALSGSTLTGGEGSVAGAFSWTDGTVKPNAGTAQYEVTFTPANPNYNTATVNVSVTVTKATPTLTAPTAGAIQYGQKLSDSTLTGGTATNPNDSATVAGSWSWANGNTQPTATGTFPVAFVPSDTANYNTPENVDTSVTVSAAAPKITLTVPAYQVANGVVEVKYTAANPHDATLNDLPAVTLTYKVGSGAEQPITDGKFTIPEGTAVDTVITVIASTAAVDGKYTAATKMATVTVTDKIPVEISGVSVTGRAYNGKAIDYTGTPVIKTLDGKTVTDATVTYTWSSGGDTGPINAGNYTLTISVDGEKYIGSTTVDFTIEKATVTITATNKSAVVGSAQPELTYTVSGLADGETLTTAPTLTCTPDMNTVGSYPITASGAAVPNTGNYNTTITYVDGTLSVTAKPSTGGGGYVPSNPGGSTLPVTTTGQGSTTTTTTTTAAPTASVGNGTATTTINTAMGQEIVRQATANKSENVVIAPSVTGNVTKAEVSIPASTVGQIGSQTSASLTVSTPVADVTIPNGGLGSLSSAGGTVTVTAEQVGSSVELTVTAGGRTIQNVPGGVTLTVPAANTTPGTVAVLVHPDGTREVVRKSVADNGAVTIPLDGSAKLEIVDNSRQFADVPATSWAADAVAFASAHELFGGTGANQFSPDLPMSRGMLAVVLHNLENNPAQALTGAFADVDNSQWYAEGVAWAEAQGIIGGYGNGWFGPNDNITREQLAVMLWRYSGSPAATDRELHFADAHRASDWALDALRWATENGIINGKGGGILDPTGQATRAEAAQMLKNFMEDR